jgi:hypothetical protein
MSALSVQAQTVRPQRQGTVNLVEKLAEYGDQLNR